MSTLWPFSKMKTSRSSKTTANIARTTHPGLIRNCFAACLAGGCTVDGVPDGCSCPVLPPWGVVVMSSHAPLPFARYAEGLLIMAYHVGSHVPSRDDHKLRVPAPCDSLRLPIRSDLDQSSR